MQGKLKNNTLGMQTPPNGLMPSYYQMTNKYTAVTTCDYQSQKLVITYQTDEEMLAQYIPEDLELLGPWLSVVKIDNATSQFIGYRPYSLLCVMAAVSFCNDEETCVGGFPLAMWENVTDPILVGREMFGVPKTYADLDPISRDGSKHYAAASRNCYTFCKMKADLPKEMSQEEIDNKNDICYDIGISLRHIPNPSGIGAVYQDLVTYPQSTKYYNGLTGTGTVEWIVPEPHENPTAEHQIKAIAALPIVKYLSASWTRLDMCIENANAHILKVLYK